MNENSINDLLNSLKEEFLTTLPERLAEIEALVLNLSDDSCSDVENLLRVVHSLKGAAGTHGFHIFTKICHQMEDMMRELIDSNKIKSQMSVDILLDYNDLQNSALDIINTGDDNFSPVDTKLNQICNTVGRQQRKVLIVEPSNLYASMIQSAIESSDIQVKIVDDGFVALENLLMQPFDAVVLALEVPTINGNALLSAVRLSQCKNKDINAILVTTRSPDAIDNADMFNKIIDRKAVSGESFKTLLKL